MLIKQIEQNLKQLEGNVYHCLQTVSKYSYDQDIPENDYSKEYLYYELFYSINNYGRGINALETDNNLNDRFDSLYQLALDTMGLEDNNFFDRLDQFGIQYFSDKRYNDQISKFVEKINFDSLKEVPDDEKPLVENNAYSLFKIRDEISLLNQENSLFVNYFKKDNKLDHYKKFEEKISVIHYQNRWLWSVFNELIEANRTALLIPNTYTWWYDLEPLSAESIELALNNSIEKSSVNKILIKAMAGQLEKLTESTNDTINWIIDNHKESFTHLLGLSKSPTPAFQTWSESPDKPTQSDHGILPNVFRSVPGINNEIIQDLIDLVQYSEKVSDEQRKNILATAYLIIGKSKEALDLLGDDKE